MAQEFNYTIKINGVDKEIKNLEQLSDAVSDLENQLAQLEEQASNMDVGSDEYKNTIKQIQKLQSEIEELSDVQSKASNDAVIAQSKEAKSIKELQKSFKALQQAQAEATDPAEYARLSAALNDVEGQLGDIRDLAASSSGSGVERLNTSFAQLQEGIVNFDGGKITNAFKGIGAAMSAIPIFLLVEGIKLLIDNWDEVVAFTKNIVGAFSDEEKAVKSASVAYEKQKLATAALVGAYDREIAQLEAAGGSERKILELKQQKIQIQIKELKASLALSNAKIAEINANDDLWESGQRLAVQALRKLGMDEKANALEKNIQLQKVARSKEELDKRRETIEAIANLENEAVVNQITFNKEQAAKAKEDAAKAKEAAEDAFNKEKTIQDSFTKYRIEALQGLYGEAEKIQAQQDIATKIALGTATPEEMDAYRADYLKTLDVKKEFDKYELEALQGKYGAAEKLIAEQSIATKIALGTATPEEMDAYKNLQIEKTKQRFDELKGISENNIKYSFKERKAALDELQKMELANEELTQEEKDAIKKKYAEKEKNLKLEGIKKDLEIAKEGADAVQSISDTIFEIKKTNTAKGTQEEEKYARKQFKINKALGISSTLIKGAEAVVSALTTSGPVGIARSIAAAAATAAAIAKIAGTQFDAGGSTSSTNIGTGASAAASSANIAVSTPSTAFNPQTINQLGSSTSSTGTDDGKRLMGPQRVYVVESDITATQNKVRTIESQASFS